MDFPAIQAQLNDLPLTFKRPGAPYNQFLDSLTAALLVYAGGTDGLSDQMVFTQAVDGWLDVWGLLFGFVRQQGESNYSYSKRILQTVLAWVGTLPALQAWVNLFAFGGTVTENVGKVGYIIALPASMTDAQVREFLYSLNRIRPAGVPFGVAHGGSLGGGGLYLTTLNFMGEGREPGSYLVDGATVGPAANLALGTLTNSALPLLPDLYMTDPILNPKLVGAA